MVNVIVLWNTLYMNAALEQLQSEGFPIKAEGVARLSSLVFDPLPAEVLPAPLARPELTYLVFAGFAVALRAGACFASRRKFSAGEFLSDVRRHRATGFVYVGELCRYLLRQPPSPLDRDHRLRYAAGAGLRPDIWVEFRNRFGIAKIFEMYGATEGNVSLMNRTGRPGSVDKGDQVVRGQRLAISTGPAKSAQIVVKLVPQWQRTEPSR